MGLMACERWLIYQPPWMAFEGVWPASGGALMVFKGIHYRLRMVGITFSKKRWLPRVCGHVMAGPGLRRSWQVPPMIFYGQGCQLFLYAVPCGPWVLA